VSLLQLCILACVSIPSASQLTVAFGVAFDCTEQFVTLDMGGSKLVTMSSEYLSQAGITDPLHQRSLLASVDLLRLFNFDKDKLSITAAACSFSSSLLEKTVADVTWTNKDIVLWLCHVLALNPTKHMTTIQRLMTSGLNGALLFTPRKSYVPVASLHASACFNGKSV
jgi:hypothetical protein